MQGAIEKADILIEAMPYIKKFQHKVMVIKCGGRQILNQDSLDNILEDIAFMNCVGLNPVLVHGGGPSINEKMHQAGKKVEFYQGQRVTDQATLEIVIKELSRLNQEMVGKISHWGARAKGLVSGKDTVIKAEKLSPRSKLGFVGKIASIKPAPVKRLLSKNLVPVIAPLGVGEKGQIYNINADVAASEIAAKLGAWKLVLLTDVQGIMRDQNDPGSLISTLRVKEIPELIERNIIQKGMIPKVKACITALNKGVKKTHIINGAIARSLLLEIFTDEGIGTQIVK